MSYKIITDSSADILALDGVDFASVPLKIITSEKEYVDNSELDVHGMITDLSKYSGRSGSSCPNTNDWIESFGDAENIFCVTITSGLSGSCNSARAAATQYMDEHPDRKVFVVDSLSAGSENALLIEKLRELVLSGIGFEEICEKISDYREHTHLIFSLDSLRNLANNGRVSPAVAKIAGIMGIRAVGIASMQGVLELTDKVRGMEKALVTIVKNMKNSGYVGGKIRIHHCENLCAAEKLKEKLKVLYPKAEIVINATRALCSFYAEKGGLLVGFEGARKIRAI